MSSVTLSPASPASTSTNAKKSCHYFESVPRVRTTPNQPCPTRPDTCQAPGAAAPSRYLMSNDGPRNTTSIQTQAQLEAARSTCPRPRPSLPSLNPPPGEIFMPNSERATASPPRPACPASSISWSRRQGPSCKDLLYHSTVDVRILHQAICMVLIAR